MRRTCAMPPRARTAALLRNELGYLLDSMGDSAAARPYYERALAIREQVLGARPSRHGTQLEQPGLSAACSGRLCGGAPVL